MKKEFSVDVDLTTRPVTSFSNRDEFNQYVEKAKAFTNPYAHQYVKNDRGVVVTRKEYRNMVDQVNRVNRTKKRAFDKIKNDIFKDRGKDTEFTVADQKQLLGDPRYDAFKPIQRDFNKFNNKKEFQEYLDNVKRVYKGDFMAKRNRLYKTNYLKALDNVFGEAANDIKEKVKSMNMGEFISLYYTENLANLSYIYDFLETQIKLESLRGVFKK